MEEGTFTEWLKKNGECVAEGDMLYVIETDKASAEIESFDSGTLYVPGNAPVQGDTVRVGQRLGWLLGEGEEPPPDERLVREEPAPTDEPPPAPHPEPEMAVTVESPVPAVSRKENGRTMSPRAARLAAELGIDWREIRGTGRSGRVREKDILQADASPTPARAAPTPAPETGAEDLPVTGVRKIIAARMRASLGETAQLTLNRGFNASRILALRKNLKERESSGSPRVTLNDIILYVVSRVLGKHPALNAHFLGNRIRQFSDVHLGIAVDSPRGLIVPVVRQANRKSLEEIAQNVSQLAERVQTGRMSPDDLGGGTFTVSNLGALGIDTFTPVLNPPEVAILGVNGLSLRPQRTANGIEHLDAMGLSLTIDHQGVDGAPGARFLADLAEALEDPVVFFVG